MHPPSRFRGGPQLSQLLGKLLGPLLSIFGPLSFVFGSLSFVFGSLGAGRNQLPTDIDPPQPRVIVLFKTPCHCRKPKPMPGSGTGSSKGR